MKSRFFIGTLVFFLSIGPLFADFSDIEYSWYRDSIETLANEKVIGGYGDGTFWPEKPITRAEILKIILQVSGNGIGETPLKKCFPDVSVNMWYHGYICRAAELSITKGFSDGKFRPNDTVTTLEALAFGFRAFGIAMPATASGELWYEPMRKFADDNHIIPTSAYSIETRINRGKATELITRIRAYHATRTMLNYKSAGCIVGKDLSKINTITIAGKTRSYILSVPSNYVRNKEYSLIVANHGRTNSNEQVQNYMGLQGSRQWSNQDDFIVAYPAGLDATGGGYSWSEAESITFFDAVIAEISGAYCIDRSNVFVVGHSLGGWFTHKLACLRGDIIHAIAGVGSSGYAGDCTGPSASLLYQNTNDALSSYESGKWGLSLRKSINLCKGDPVPVTIGPLTCQKWNSCSPGNPVIWCEGYTAYGGDPHSWPITGGADILSFFRGLR